MYIIHKQHHVHKLGPRTNSCQSKIEQTILQGSQILQSATLKACSLSGASTDWGGAKLHSSCPDLLWLIWQL